MLPRALPDLQEQDFDQLVTNAVSERRDLEFKRDLPGGADAETKEFLADVTSLANAQGGGLVFGVEDVKGVAAKIVGVDGTNVDATILRLENIIRDGVEPRISVKAQWVPLASGRGVLVLRLPASLSAPHRIRFKNSGRFWTRNSKGKYEMDVHELRHAFTQSEEMPARLRGLHHEAVNAAEGLNMPFRLDPEPTAVISIMPLGFLRGHDDYEVTPENTILPVKASSSNWLPTLEGMLWYTPPNEKGTVRAYALTHRSGRIDAAFTFGGLRQLNNGENVKLVFARSFEEGVAEMAVHGVGRLKSYGIEGPWVVMVTVFGIREAIFAINDGEFSRKAWRQMATLPELVLEHVSFATLMPIHKAFWLLFGETRPADRRSS